MPQETTSLWNWFRKFKTNQWYLFYPGDEWKGDVARMVMYMYVRYGNQCLPNVVAQGSNAFSADIPDILLQWNVEDPVSQFELNRISF
jgi:endonuclease I